MSEGPKVSTAAVLGAAGILGLCIVVAVVGGAFVVKKLEVGPKPTDQATLNTGGNDELLAAFTARLAQAIRADERMRTTGQLRDGMRNAATLLRATEDLPEHLPDSDGDGVSDFDEAVGSRIEAAVGLENRELTPEVREAIAVVLQGVSEELGQ